MLSLSWGENQIYISHGRSTKRRRGIRTAPPEDQFGARARFIKTSERTSFSISSPTSSLQVKWSTFRPHLAAISQTMTLVGQSSLIEVSGPYVRSSTLRHFSCPSRSPPSCNRLELFQASPMEHRNNRQHDIRCGPVRLVARLSQYISQADQTRVVLYSLRLRQAYGAASRTSTGLLSYQQITFGKPPSLQCLNPPQRIGNRLWFHWVDTRLPQHVSMPLSRDDASGC